MKYVVILLLLGVSFGPASSSEATPEALVRFAGFDAGLRQAVGDHAQIRLDNFPTAGGEVLTLELERFQLTLPSTKIVLVTDRGEEEMATPDIALLRGSVAGEPGSCLEGLDNLRHKESDRLMVMVENLSRLGAGISIEGSRATFDRPFGRRLHLRL